MDEVVLRSADALMKEKDKYRFTFDVDSTEDPAYGNQEDCVYNGRANVEHPALGQNQLSPF